MNTDRLKAKAESVGNTRVAQICDALMATDCPAGVRVERTDEGVCLIGKNLRRRMIDDARLRNFGR